jgi:hypothetical protein
MAASLGVALAIVLIVRVGVAPGDRVGMALRATARWSFVLFWLASVGGALAPLFGSRFQALARRGRDLGLAFASLKPLLQGELPGNGLRPDLHAGSVSGVGPRGVNHTIRSGH